MAALLIVSFRIFDERGIQVVVQILRVLLRAKLGRRTKTEKKASGAWLLTDIFIKSTFQLL